MSTTVARPEVRVIPERRRKVRAYIITGLMFGRSLLASRFFFRPLFRNINGAPCVRDRVGPMPELPFFMAFRLKWLWLRGIWADTIESHADGLERAYEKHIAKIEGYVQKRYPLQTKSHPLPEYDWRNGNAEDFYAKYIQTPQPVVLRGYALQTDAVKSWTFQSLVEKCGEVDVNITGPESDWPGKLKEVLDPTRYCANADAPFKEFPELAEQLSIPQLEPYIKRRNTWNQFFIGQKETGSGYHCAGIWNFFFMIEGQKKWTFVDPELSWMVYPSISTGALAFASLLLFPDKADLNTYSLYKYCPRYEVTLNPGDVLLNPPWWWHTIDNITPTSVAVATRWDALMKDFSFYEINRILSVVAIFNPRFGRFLVDYLKTHDGKGRQILRQGGGAFEEDDMNEKRTPSAQNQAARISNAYYGKIFTKIKNKKKW